MAMEDHTAFRRVGGHRYRETAGLYFEDFVVGDIFEHRPGRTLTDADNIWFTLLTMNTQQLHFDAAYAASTEWKKPLVNSCLTLSILTGMSVKTVSGKLVANLGWDKVKAAAPVFVNDTLYAQSRVISKRPSASRSGQGIVKVETMGINQDGVTVMSFERTVLVHMRGYAPHLDERY